MWKRYFFLDQMTFEVAYKLTPVRQSVRHSDVHHSVCHSVCPCDDFGLFKTALRGPPPDPISSHFAKFRQQATKFRYFSLNFATFCQILPLFARFCQNFAKLRRWLVIYCQILLIFRQIPPNFAISSTNFAILHNFSQISQHFVIF